MAKLRRWGPWAWSADLLVGWPSLAANRPQLLGVGLVWALPRLITEVWPVLSRFGLVLGLHLVHLSLILCSDIFCDFLSGQSVPATCILAQKKILHICKGKVCFRNIFE